MSEEFTIELMMHERRGRSGRRRIHPGDPPTKPDLPTGRVPRIARLMALAIRCEELVRHGEVADYADVARLAHVTRARISQITNLLNLAPDIQDALLHLPRTVSGRDSISERDVRPIAITSDWQAQRQMWHRLSNRHDQVDSPR